MRLHFNFGGSNSCSSPFYFLGFLIICIECFIFLFTSDSLHLSGFGVLYSSMLRAELGIVDS